VVEKLDYKKVTMKSLGLDLSTTTCGYAITENKQILAAGFVDISKAEKYQDKADLIIKALTGHSFEKITIEESLFGFARGGTSQQVIIKLVKNKAVVGFILENHYKVPVASIHAQTARKAALGAARPKKIKGGPKMKPKEYVKSMIEKMYDMTPWIVLNTKGNPDKRNEDMYDALVLSLAG
jgi:Holliday junction resolvasome RuvABC endonuclease subunit